MRVSVGLPTGMEGLTYPIPFSDPDTVIQIAEDTANKVAQTAVKTTRMLIGRDR